MQSYALASSCKESICGYAFLASIYFPSMDNMRDVLTFSSLECLAQYVAKSAKTYGREPAITCARVDEDPVFGT